MIRTSPAKPKREIAEDVSYFVPVREDSARLRAMARTAFSDTFSHLYEDQPFNEFLELAYGNNGAMEKDLADQSVQWHAAEVGREIVGYVKLRQLVAPAPNPQNGALELQQIYVLREWHGSGIAERLVRWALEWSAAVGAPEIYLTVFDHNERAKKFYTRHGFGCTFQLGDRIDDDRVWRRVL